MSRKKQASGENEALLDLFCQSNLFPLKDYYGSLTAEVDMSHTTNSVARRHVYSKLYDTDLFPLKDAGLQSRLSQEINGMITFIESTFLINIVTIRVKFTISSNNKPVFIGANDCFFTFKQESSVSVTLRRRKLLRREQQDSY